MTNYPQSGPNGSLRQRGFATLVTSLMILFLVTLVTLFSANMAVVEQQISSNQYRADQALAAADAGMDWALNYFDSNGGLGCTTTAPCTGQDANGNALYGDNDTFFSNSDAPHIEVFFCQQGQVYNINSVDDLGDTAKCTTPTSVTSSNVGIVSVGYSDDRAGVRIVKQEIRNKSFLGEGPATAISSPSVVDMSGAINVINRYTDTNIWSGEVVKAWGNSKSYVHRPAKEGGVDLQRGDLDGDGDADDRADLTDHEVDNDYTKRVSGGDNSAQANYDVRDGDINLRKLKDDPDALFAMFFNGATKEEFKEAADSQGQYYAAGEWPNSGWDRDGSDGAIGGFIYIVGEDISLGEIGAIDTAAVIVVEGSVNVGANDETYGMLYVADPDPDTDNDGDGDFRANGGGIFKGAIITEGAVKGNGGPTIVYDPDAFDSADLPTTVARVSGTWADW